MHELDRINKWKAGREPDIVPTAGNPTAEIISRNITYWAEEENVNLSEVKFLGLAAGQAVPELYVVSALGIKSENVTLVDRNFSGYSRDNIVGNYPGIEAVDSGLFTYLQHPTTSDFSIVTALGIEYAFETTDEIKQLITLLPNVLKKGGLVLVFPYDGIDPASIWQRNNFRPLYDTGTSFQVQVFQGRI